MAHSEKLICREYLDFVKSKPCIALGVHIGPTDPHHLIAVGWRRAKQNDFSAVSLCRKHHGELEQIGPSKFENLHSVNLWRENCRLLTEFFIQLSSGLLNSKVHINGVEIYGG